MSCVDTDHGATDNTVPKELGSVNGQVWQRTCPFESACLLASGTINHKCYNRFGHIDCGNLRHPRIAKSYNSVRSWSSHLCYHTRRHCSVSPY